MIRNYLTIAIRTLLRDRLTTTINVVGLSVAVASTILLGIGLKVLLEGDGTFVGSDRLFRVLAREVHSSGEVYRRAWQPPDLAGRLAEAFPTIGRKTRVIRTDILMAVGERHGFQEALLVDEAFGVMFDLPFYAGSREQALSRPDQVVLTRWLAEMLFADSYGHLAEVIGREVTFYGNRGNDTYTVSGILDDLPVGRSLQYEALIRYENRKKYGSSNFYGASVSTYVQLQPGSGVNEIDSQLADFSRGYIAPVWEKHKGRRFKDNPDAYRLILQPLAEVRSGDDVVNIYEAQVGDDFVWSLSAMMAIIIVIASINFVSLSIARSTSRTLEVGVRKVLGARRVNVIQQFWGEGLVIASMGVVGGFVLAELLLPAFNGLIGNTSGYELELSDLGTTTAIVGAVCLVLSIGIGAGSYPAWVASRFQPTESIGGKTGGRSKRRVMKLLLVGQYAMAVFLLVCTAVMGDKLAFMHNQDLGYDGDQVVVVQLRGQKRIALGQRYKEALRQVPGVLKVSLSDREFAQSTSHTTIRTSDGKRISPYQFAVDADFFETLGIEFVAGRPFEADRISDRTKAVIVNERLAKLQGWESGAVGEQIDGFGNYGVSKTPTVIGLVPDFHYRSFREKVAPAIFHFGIHSQFNRVLVRISTDHISETLAALRKTWTSVAAGVPFEYTFFDEAFARQYQGERSEARLFGSASAIAILIACMGLFGQAAIAVRQRTKEIGVRKVLGASVAEIGKLLSRDVVKLVVVANVLAWPLAHHLMSEWLSTYKYRVPLGASTFVVCGLVALGIAMLTVGWIGVKAARGNPVEALRYE